MLVRPVHRSMVRPVSLALRRTIATLEGNPHIVNQPPSLPARYDKSPSKQNPPRPVRLPRPPHHKQPHPHPPPHHSPKPNTLNRHNNPAPAHPRLPQRKPQFFKNPTLRPRSTRPPRCKRNIPSSSHGLIRWLQPRIRRRVLPSPAPSWEERWRRRRGRT